MHGSKARHYRRLWIDHGRIEKRRIGCYFGPVGSAPNRIHRCTSPSRLHISTEEGAEQAEPAIKQFSVGGECRCLETDATERARVETELSDPRDACRAGVQCNPIIQRGWNYYGAFYQTAMFCIYEHIDRALERWARREYKALSGRKRCSVQWLRKMKGVEPQLLHHSRVVGDRVG